MRHSDFVHLHNHSDFSLLDGASPIPGMVERAAALAMPALALTDHGSLFGAVEFYQEARRAGVKPIVGMEAYVTRGRRQDRTRDTAHHLVLLARDEPGFRNLMKLSSLAFLEGFYYKPRVDHELLDRHAQGLLALSACPKGEIGSAILEDDDEEAYRTAVRYREIFGAENFFLEIQDHGLAIEDKIRTRVTALAGRTGIPLVATNDCHYLRHEDADAHDVLLCIQTGKSIEDAKRLRYATDQLYFRSADEMRERFAGQPEALRNTLAIAERCNLQMDFGKPLLPAFPLPEGVGSAEDHLRALTGAALAERYPAPSAEVRRRMAYELDVICRMGFASYFLIVRDFIDFARRNGIGVGPGRGSVAGSLVAYVLRITDIDPLRHGLIFERFLNPERVSMPDIDIDFDDLRRGEVIDYVKEKYGHDNVTQIITFGTMGAKGVMRDVGRALGMAFADVDRIAKMVPDGLGMTLERALELSPDLKALPAKGPQLARMVRTARVLEGLARHASTHAAGVLITPGPLLDYVPLYRQKDETVTTQWDMKSVEKAGLLKMDFLGLRTLSVLDDAVRLVKTHRGVAIDLQALPMDDAEAYR
ncbi:MAG: DNA polymerase III subunit alpha, partial [Candidatus Eiseniibacteriota bacterium]